MDKERDGEVCVSAYTHATLSDARYFDGVLGNPCQGMSCRLGSIIIENDIGLAVAFVDVVLGDGCRHGEVFGNIVGGKFPNSWVFEVLCLFIDFCHGCDQFVEIHVPVVG